MYVRTLERLGLGLGQPLPAPQSPLRIPAFSSSVIIYKDKDGDHKCRSTKCSVYVPSALRNDKEIDVLVFFHGHDIDPCKRHFFAPELVVKNFRLDDQVENAARKVALAVPSMFWRYDAHPNGSDLKNIRVAWSAAYLNAFVEEVLDKIGLEKGGKPGDRPNLGGLILAGHSRAYDILTPLADQFGCGVPETRKGALAKLDKVLAMDTTYGLQHAKALEQWARSRGIVKFILVLSKEPTPRNIWKNWEKAREKTTGHVERPGNLDVQPKPMDKHCDLPRNYVGSLL